MQPFRGRLRPTGMARKLHRGALQSVAAALVLAALAVACQPQGSAGATAAATHPASSAVAAANNQPASPVPPGPGPFASDATDRKLATSRAAGIQQVFTPPPGSRKLAGPPTGTWRDIGVPGGVIPTDGEVFVSSWWKVPGQPQAVLKWLLAHEPKPWYGGGRGSFGPVAEPGDVTPAGQPPADVYQERNDTFEDFHGPAVIGEQQLIVEELQNGVGQTYTRVDSLVSWTPPRPAAERVPASAKVVTITAEPMAGTAMPQGSPATVTDPATVARIAALVNGLYRNVGLCAPPPPTPDRIELTFRAEPGGPPLATADADFRGCRQVSFSVPGTSALPLLAEVNDRLVPAILSVAGLTWFS
jgi:hypothetical protein